MGGVAGRVGRETAGWDVWCLRDNVGHLRGFGAIKDQPSSQETRYKQDTQRAMVRQDLDGKDTQHVTDEGTVNGMISDEG